MTVDVLLVDEDTDVLEVSATFLGRQEGLSVSTESDPERALERVRDENVDAVVSDLGMPKLDGIELCQRIRDRGGDIPFFLFSGRESDTIREAAQSGQVTGFVQKGTGMDQYETLGTQIREATD